MTNGDVPLVVCVSADTGVREQVVRRLEDCGAVLICADLDELRAMLFPSGRSTPALGATVPFGGPGVGNPVPANSPAGNPPFAPNGVNRPPGAGGLGDLVVDVAGHLITWRGRPLPLTRLERELLARLASQPISVWSYQRLFDAVWGKAYLGDTSILHSAVKRLRSKLRTVEGGLGVETVRGVGYRLAIPA